MKKYILPLLCACAMTFTACSNDDNEEVLPLDTVMEKPSTEIFVQGQKVQAKDAAQETKAALTQTRVNVATGKTYGWPQVNTTEGWEVARFSIRADGYIPGYIDQSSTLYYGRSAGKQGKNRGRVSSIYPYGRYNDRDLDYYQRDKKTGNNIGLFRYVLDTDGQKTQLAILEQPSVKDILEDEKADAEAAIAKNQNVTKNQTILDGVNALLDKGEDYLNNHVLWYVVKEVAGQYLWHVNGVIVDYEVPDARANGFANVPNDVEIDIHQQIHQDWNEIKTSVHIRAACESIKINIPLEYEDIIEQDDFAIRVYDFYYKEYAISHTVTHDTNGITIEISNIPADLIQELRENYGDGLTVEIHSYCTNEDIWNRLSQSKVVSLGNKNCTVHGQVTSAYRDGEKVLLYAPKN